MKKLWIGLFSLVLLWPGWLGSEESKSGHEMHKKDVATGQSDIITAVKIAATKDCGCGSCASRGCKPCHGKNCYYCVAKALVTKECGCDMCSAKGCSTCGPGCDVCKFHLGPVAEAKKKPEAKAKKKNK